MDQGPADGHAGIANERRQRQERLVRIARRLEGRAADDPRFVAVGIEIPEDAVIMWRTGDEPGDDSADIYRSVVPSGVELIVRRAVLSNAQKDALDKLVASTTAELRSHGMRPVAWGNLDGWERPYVIGYEGPSSLPADLVKRFQIYGSGTVVLRREPAPDGGVGVVRVGDIGDDREIDYEPAYRRAVEAQHDACTGVNDDRTS